MFCLFYVMYILCFVFLCFVIDPRANPMRTQSKVSHFKSIMNAESAIHTGDFLHQSPPILGFSNLSDFVYQQLLQFNYPQFKSTYKTGSITASLLLLTSLFYYHVVTYKQITANFMIYGQFIKTLLQRSVEL